jgi:hypothetical protein
MRTMVLAVAAVVGVGSMVSFSPVEARDGRIPLSLEQHKCLESCRATLPASQRGTGACGQKCNVTRATIRR